MEIEGPLESLHRVIELLKPLFITFRVGRAWGGYYHITIVDHLVTAQGFTLVTHHHPGATCEANSPIAIISFEKVHSLYLSVAAVLRSWVPEA